jgi:diadenosine tetraphosphatase ApaH/serine/threonine PP2A family protein phosphatase
MKIAILSDIHANQVALEHVLKCARSLGAGDIWFLGDAVDRGPYSQPILAWLRELDQQADSRWMIGNHEALLAGILTPEEIATFNVLPREDNLHHRAELQALPDVWDFVRTRFTRQAWLPQEVIQAGALYVLVHASLTDGPGFFTLLYPWNIEISLPREFGALEKRCQTAGMPGVMFFGHTHVPTLIFGQRGSAGKWEIGAEAIVPGKTYHLDPSRLWLINPGSVGQPRDLDNRTAFAVLDTSARSITFHRVTYDWRSVARELLRLNRHPRLAEILRDANVDSKTPEAWREHYRKAREVPDEFC